MMDLECSELFDLAMNSGSGPYSERPPDATLLAPEDRGMTADPRVLQNLLLLEMSTVPQCDYFVHVQDDLLPFMRKVVTTWMLEVCEEQNCEEQVFPLSVNYLDRFLCSRAVPRNQLQLLASAALLVASKVRQCIPLPVLLLCAYTDNSITPDELRTWELLLLQRLEWQISAVTAYDLVEHVLARIVRGPARTLLRRHAHTLAALCYTETEFMRMRPSLTAVACVISAAQGMSRMLGGAAAAAELGAAAAAITSLCPVNLRRAVGHVELLVARESAAAVTPQPPMAKPMSPITTAEAPSPHTPTHVHDVHF